MKKTAIFLSIVLAIGGAAIVFMSDDPVFAQATVETGPLDIETGRALYEENCAACHGANLEGQPNWQSKGADGRLPAPPHDESGHTWHHGDGLLFEYTKLGGKGALAARGMEFDSGMPGFGESLTDAEIQNIIEYIKSTWTERMQEVQAQRTENEKLSGN